ncbi:MAG: TetR family transcriptional regulator, partial [Burkholderiaceae bacterium]|nr:TetR family transcriptional regulator [Burkholderiaceae bacterium]
AVSVIEQVLASGVTQGIFRPDIRARDLYLLIASMGYFYQSNRYTLSAFLGEDIDLPESVAHWDEFMIDVVLRTVKQ